VRKITEGFAKIIHNSAVGKETNEILAMESNEQLARRLLGDVVKLAPWRSQVRVDDTYSGYIIWKRGLKRGEGPRLFEFREYNQVAVERGKEIASADTILLSMFSGEEGNGEDYDLVTTFGISSSGDALLVSQARNFNIDINNPAELERLQRYPIYGIMGRTPAEQWQELIVAVSASESYPTVG